MYDQSSLTAFPSMSLPLTAYTSPLYKKEKEVRLLHLICKGQLFDYIQSNKLGKIRVDVLCTPTSDI